MKLLFLLCLLHLAMQATAQTCGRPGKPEHGDRIPLNESYNEGDQVMYICDNGYYLKREDEFVQAENRTCQFNGTWSGTVPECDYIDVIFNTALDVTGVNLPFLIDGKDETCGEVKFNKSAPGATRSFNIPWHNFTHSTAYVRISLGNTDNRMKHKIRVVLLPSYAQCKEVPPPKVTEVLLKCDSRESTTHAWFSFPTALLHNEQALSICSLNIFVQSDATCGSPDEPLHGTFTHNGATSAYSCKSGYSLTGDSAASCTNETGYRWHPYSAPECLSNGETGTALVCIISINALTIAILDNSRTGGFTRFRSAPVLIPTALILCFYTSQLLEKLLKQANYGIAQYSNMQKWFVDGVLSFFEHEVRPCVQDVNDCNIRA